MDRLTSLTVFGRVVETGGFSAAARRLNMSVTSVSNHVQALEDRLGARLLNRTTRKVSLTEIGKAYYERTTQILAELDEADRLATELHATPRGTLRLYAVSAVVRFLTPIVEQYLTLYPAVSVDLTVGERMVDLMDDGYDLMIRTTPSPDSELVVRVADIVAPRAVLRAVLSAPAPAAAGPGRRGPPQLPALHALSVRQRVALPDRGRHAGRRCGCAAIS